MNDCSPVSVNGNNGTMMDGWKRHDSTNNTYRIGSNAGGCVDASGTPVRDVNWSTVIFGSSTTSSVANFPGYTKSTSSATYNGAPLTCTNVNGAFASNGTTPTASSSFNY